MFDKIILISMVLLIASLSPSCGEDFSAGHIQGSLVIDGCTVSPDNDAAHRGFIEKAMQYRGRNKSEIVIGIMPTASIDPLGSVERARESFASYGVSSHNIHMIPIIYRNEGEKNNIGESQWKKSVMSRQLADTIETYDGIWFVGGDQFYYTNSLYDGNGKRTPVLESIWKIYVKGAVIGGTSAGAAMMSDPMIGGGDSLSSLSNGMVDSREKSGSGVYVTRGLGFFSRGIVDQHFNQRGRLGRLIIAALGSGVKSAYGIDEDTALIVDNGKRIAQVVGRHGVTVIDVSSAERKRDASGYSLSGIIIHYLEAGDMINLADNTIIPQERSSENSDKEKTGAVDEREFTAVTDNSILLSVREAVTEKLFQSKESRGIAYTWTAADHASGFLFRFRKTDQTRIVMGTVDGQKRVSAVHVNLEISPIDININKFNY